MMRGLRRWTTGFVAIAIALSSGAAVVVAQKGAPANGEWRSYGSDTGGARYSPLDQIDASNFSKLELVWSFKPDNFGARPAYAMQATPLMVNGVLYLTAGTRRNVVALDAVTGEMRWMYRIEEGERGAKAGRRTPGRGVGYWTDGKGDERIYLSSIGYQLVCLNAKDGVPCRTFGKNGVVDLKLEDDQVLDLVTADLGWNGAPIVARDMVIIGASGASGNSPRSKENAKGYVRAYDTRTGKRKWIFHTIAQPGEFGNETWENDSWSYTGNTGVWSQMTVDEELGIVYLPVESATGDYYGGHRHGANLFEDSLVAVNLETGKRMWHFQFVHHGLWDFDLPAPPLLANVTVDGKPMKIVAAPTKQGLLFVFDRVTGKPVWPIEERPVPQGKVPGEWYSPTQPFPTKPPPFERNGFTESDVLDFTPEIKAEAIKALAKYKTGPLYTPPIVKGEDGKDAMIFVPNGSNWPGGSVDPETGIMYLFSHNPTRLVGLVNDPKRSNMNFINGAGGEDRVLSVQGLPISKTPWGKITAIDLNKGEILWQIAHGDTPDYVKNHPALKGVTVPRTGRAQSAGSGGIGVMTTKTLVISGEGGIATQPNGQRGALLRAYDKKTGADAGAVFMPAPQESVPMTYMVKGKQYIAVAVGGGNVTAELRVYALP